MKHYTWSIQKPLFTEECLLITAHLSGKYWEYTVYQIARVNGEQGWYMGWLTGDGEEYGDLADLRSQKYLTMPLL